MLVGADSLMFAALTEGAKRFNTTRRSRQGPVDQQTEAPPSRVSPTVARWTHPNSPPKCWVEAHNPGPKTFLSHGLSRKAASSAMIRSRTGSMKRIIASA